MRSLKISPFESASMLFSLILAVSVFTFASPCEEVIGSDGASSWMTCHWMAQAVFGLALAMTAINFMSMCFISRRIKIGLSVAVLPVALAAMAMPTLLIGVCHHADAHCVMITQPVVLVFSVLIMVLSLLNALMQFRHVQARQK